jgi:parallel beta-helix repeat protein
MRKIVATRVAGADTPIGGHNPLRGKPVTGRRTGMTSAALPALPSGAGGRSRPRRVRLPRCLGLLTLLLCGSTAKVMVAAAATYYVDGSSPTCSPTGPGTEAQPYCAISQAVNLRAQPGNTILVKPGVYREQVTIRASGTAGNPIVVRATGPGVVIDGADDYSQTGLWVAAGGTVWRAASVTWKPVRLFVDGVPILAATDSTAPPPVNRFTWVSGQGLFLNLGGGNPGLRQTLVGARSYGFNMATRSWITIDGFTVLHTESRGIFMQSGCANVTIARNTVRLANANGIHAVGGTGIVIEGNVAAANGPHGIGLTAGATDCIIRDNESYGSTDPDIRRADGIYLYEAPRNTLYRNRVHNNQDSGIHFGPGAHDCVAFNNRSWSNGDHGYDHLGASGTTHVNDVAFGNTRDGFSIEGGATGTRLYNCIAVNDGVTTNDHNLWVEPGSEVGFVSDHNIFWNASAQEPINYLGTEYATIEQYRVASGQDANSIQANPLFADPAAGDFRLLPGSPAIDSGNSDAPYWPSTDVTGQPRVDVPGIPNSGVGTIRHADRGVFEYQFTAPVARLSVTPGSGPAPLAVTADASAASDADGPLVSYRFDFGDGTVVGPQSSPVASHSYNAGNRTVTVTVTDGDGMTDSETASVAVASSLHAVLVLRPATGNQPLTTLGDATGTTDPYRTIVSYLFDFGDGTTVGPQASPTAGHAYAPGTWTATMTARNDLGEQSTATTRVIVDETGPGPNWVGNPSWESDTSGWTPENATATRITGGFDGTRALRVQGPANTAPFGIGDGPDWVASTPGEAARLRFKAWVRSATGAGSVRLRIRESDAAGRSLGPIVQSPAIRLGPEWQLVAVEYLCRAGGSTIDFGIIDSPAAAGEAFEVDNVSIHTVTDGSTLVPPGAGFVPPVVFPNPMLDRGSLRFTISQPGPLKVEIFDVTGRVVRTLVDEAEALPGQFEYALDDLTDRGRRSAPGMYFYLLQSREKTVSGRFLILR